MYNEINLDKIDLRQEPPLEEPARQYYFMAECRQYTKRFFEENGPQTDYIRACLKNKYCTNQIKVRK